MRKVLEILILSATLSVLSSCYKDLSTEASFEYPEIEVAENNTVMSVSYGEELHIEPVFSQEGYSDEDFDYLWEIDLQENSPKNRVELGTERNLDYKVGNLPSSMPYILSVRITNRKLGFSKYIVWKVFVSGSLGEGILVAHSRDGGLSTDLDLVSAAPVTYGYTASEPRSTRNLYSFANDGRTIEGRVNQMCAYVGSDGKLFNRSEVMIATDKGLFSVNPLTYKESRRGTEMFYNYTDADMRAEAVFNYCSYVSGAVINNKLYANVCNGDCHYSITICGADPSDFFTKENVSYCRRDQSAVCAFNPNDGKFYSLVGYLSASGGFSTITGSLGFDAVGARCIGAGGLNQLDHGFVMVDKAGVAHLCYVVVDDNSITDYVIEGVNMDEVVDCAFCDNSKIVYLATKDKIYVLMISGNTLIVSTLSWKPDESGEKITSIQQYCQAWFGLQQISLGDYEFTLDTNRTQIIITTYNPTTGEGKFYLRPFNLNTGKFTYTSNGVYGGFGEISAITSTLR